MHYTVEAEQVPTFKQMLNSKQTSVGIRNACKRFCEATCGKKVFSSSVSASFEHGSVIVVNNQTVKDKIQLSLSL